MPANPIPVKLRRQWAAQALDRLVGSCGPDSIREIPIKHLATRLGVHAETVRTMLRKRGIQPPAPGRTWMGMIDNPQPGEAPTLRFGGGIRRAPRGGCE